MAEIAFGDLWHMYAKPSLIDAGRPGTVIRKSTSRQTSARLKARKDAVATAGRAGKLAKAAHDTLVAEKKCPSKRVYKPGVGYEEKPVCPIKLMIPELRENMLAVA